MKLFLDKNYYIFLNIYRQLKYQIGKQHRREKKLLADNIQYKNIHQGKRCFIVANGPSINEENLDLIKGEIIFTVNQGHRKNEFADLKPSYHVWADPRYFDKNTPDFEKEEFKKLFIKTCNVNEKIITFVPVFGYDFLKENSLLYPDNKISFFNSSLYYYDGYNKEFDYTKPMMEFNNIVQFAIGLAVYMGFKEIYMLGCDSTGIITKINSKMNSDVTNGYAYKLDEKENQYVNSLYEHYSIESQFKGWARIFHLYGELAGYCKRRDIKLVNCSKKTIIEDIPRQSLEEVIKENKNG